MAGRHIVVAIDGSPISKQAFLEVWENFLREEDKISVVHYYNPFKANVPYHLRKEVLYQEYESYLLPHRVPDKYELCFLEKSANRKIAELIQDKAEHLRASLLVIGFHGLKGPKATPTIMSSTVDRAVKVGKTPILLVKRHLTRGEAGFHWCVLVDGSERSLKGLELTLELMDRVRDQITLLHGYNQSHVDYREYYMPKLLEVGVRGRYEEVACGLNIANEVINHVNSWETEFDILTVGVDGRNASNEMRAGSVALSVMAWAKVLKSSKGRDKILALIQYAADLYKECMLDYLSLKRIRKWPGSVRNSKLLTNSMKTGRKLFRLFLWVEVLHKLFTELSKPMSSIRVLKLFKLVSDAAYNMLDNIVWLSKIGVVTEAMSSESWRWERTKNYVSIFKYIFVLTLTVITVSARILKESNLKHQLLLSTAILITPGSPEFETALKLLKCRAQMRYQLIEIARVILRMIIVYKNLKLPGSKAISNTFSVVCGLISVSLSIFKLLTYKAKQSIEERANQKN